MSATLSWLVDAELRSTLVPLLLAFACAQTLAGVYLITFRGMSFTRSAVHTMAAGALIPCMLVMATGSNLAAGVGVAGGLALVRFRTTLRDPRDIVFVFATLGVGVACGVRAYPVAVAGAFTFSAAMLLLHAIAYGSRLEVDGLVRFTAPTGDAAGTPVAQALRSSCHSFVLVTLREAAQGEAMEHAYQVSTLGPAAHERLVRDLQQIPGVRDVTLMMQEPTLDL